MHAAQSTTPTFVGMTKEGPTTTQRLGIKMEAPISPLSPRSSTRENQVEPTFVMPKPLVSTIGGDSSSSSSIESISHHLRVPAAVATAATVRPDDSMSMPVSVKSTTPIVTVSMAPPTTTTNSSRVASTATSSTSSSVAPVQGTRLEKEQFMEFTRILMKYLQMMNPALCKKAQLMLVDYSERHRRQEAGYEQLSVRILKSRLRNLVGDCYWTRVEGHYKRFRQVQKTQAKRIECLRVAQQTIHKQKLRQEKLRQLQQPRAT